MLTNFQLRKYLAREVLGKTLRKPPRKSGEAPCATRPTFSGSGRYPAKYASARAEAKLRTLAITASARKRQTRTRSHCAQRATAPARSPTTGSADVPSSAPIG